MSTGDVIVVGINRLGKKSLSEEWPMYLHDKVVVSSKWLRVSSLH